MKAWERLINYVTVRTPSDEESETVPSSVISAICMENFRRRKEKKRFRHLDLSHIWIQFLIFVIMRSDRWLPKIMMAGIWYLAQADWY